MQKKPFIKRANRGFLVAMVLLAIAVVYVAATQIMRIPQKAQIAEIGDRYMEVAAKAINLEAARLEKLTDKAEKDKLRQELKADLTALFVPEADYLEAAVNQLMQFVDLQLESETVITRAKGSEIQYQETTLVEDVGSIQRQLTFTNDGKFLEYDYNTGEARLVEKTDADAWGNVSLFLKKVNGGWKLFRVKALNWDATYYGEGKWY